MTNLGSLLKDKIRRLGLPNQRETESDSSDELPADKDVAGALLRRKSPRSAAVNSANATPSKDQEWVLSSIAFTYL